MRTTLLGITGVLVPGDKTGGPMEVERSITARLEKSDELDCGSGSDAMDGDEVETKFESLVQQEEDSYAKACVGLMHGLLETAAATSAADKGAGLVKTHRATKPKAEKRKSSGNTALGFKLQGPSMDDDETPTIPRSGRKSSFSKTTDAGPSNLNIAVRHIVPFKSPAKGGSAELTSESPAKEAPSKVSGSADDPAQSRPGVREPVLGGGCQ